jgi:hypothetical protein
MEENIKEKEPPNIWKIAGYNLLALVGYTLVCRFIDGGMILDAFILAIHVVACIITSIAVKKWEWLLSAFVVLAIGFSTCATLLTLPNMH